MADIVRTKSQLISDCADNIIGAITPQVQRNFITSVLGVIPYTIKTSSYSLTIDDEAIVCDASSGNINITIPSALPGKRYKILKIDSSINTVTLLGTINGIVNPIISKQYVCQSFFSEGISWYFDTNVINNSGIATVDFGSAPGKSGAGSTRSVSTWVARHDFGDTTTTFNVRSARRENVASGINASEGQTYRYAWTTVGTDPGFTVGGLVTGSHIKINSANFLPSNNGAFQVTNVVDDAYGTGTVTIGTSKPISSYGTMSISTDGYGITLDTGIYSTGTISVDATGLIVTLTGGIFPANITASSCLMSIDLTNQLDGYGNATDAYGGAETKLITSRDSNTQITLSSAVVVAKRNQSNLTYSLQYGIGYVFSGDINTGSVITLDSGSSYGAPDIRIVATKVSNTSVTLTTPASIAKRNQTLMAYAATTLDLITVTGGAFNSNVHRGSVIVVNGETLEVRARVSSSQVITANGSSQLGGSGLSYMLYSKYFDVINKIGQEETNKTLGAATNALCTAHMKKNVRPTNGDQSFFYRAAPTITYSTGTASVDITGTVITIAGGTVDSQFGPSQHSTVTFIDTPTEILPIASVNSTTQVTLAIPVATSAIEPGVGSTGFGNQPQILALGTLAIDSIGTTLTISQDVFSQDLLPGSSILIDVAGSEYTASTISVDSTGITLTLAAGAFPAFTGGGSGAYILLDTLGKYAPQEKIFIASRDSNTQITLSTACAVPKKSGTAINYILVYPSFGIPESRIISTVVTSTQITITNPVSISKRSQSGIFYAITKQGATGLPYILTRYPLAGATGTIEPVWPITEGVTVADGEILWTAFAEKIVITGQANVTASSRFVLSKQLVATTDHSIEDVVVSDFDLEVYNVIPGQSFEILAFSKMGRLTGKYNIIWEYK